MFARGLPDFLAGVVRTQVAGRRLVLGMPLSAAASLHSSALQGGEPLTISNLFKLMLDLDLKAFHDLTGMWVMLNPGECVVVPPGFILAEFPADDINVTMSYSFLAERHCTKEYGEYITSVIQLGLSTCSQPSHHSTEMNLRVLSLYTRSRDNPRSEQTVCTN